MSVNQTKRKKNGSTQVAAATKITKDKLIRFIKDDLSSRATNQINSLVRRREFTKNYDLYNEKIKEVILHELKKGCAA